MMLKSINHNGFTMIELLIALAMGSVFLMIVSVFFYFQQVTYITQEQLAEMQHNARSSKYFLEREIQMAGFDPTGAAGASILIGERGCIQFQVDLDESGAIDNKNETITYALKGDENNDGRADEDLPFCHLGRSNGSGLQTIAENIDAINFVYFGAGHQRLGNCEGRVLEAELRLIRSVQVSIVARSGKNIPVLFKKYIDNRVYKNKVGEIILDSPGDCFRRIQMTFEVKCRNTNQQAA